MRESITHLNNLPRLRLVIDNPKPKKQVYCRVCQGNTWITGYQGRLDYDKPNKVKICINCLAIGKVTVI